MVEGTGLENRHTGNGIVSSNLTLSARERAVKGRVAEWFKAHAWKVCLRQKRNVGSNPTPSVREAFVPFAWKSSPR